MESESPNTDLSDSEIIQHVNAVDSASSRIRLVLAALAITCIVVEAGILNSNQHGWLNSRFATVQVALRNQIWRPGTAQRIRNCQKTLELARHKVSAAAYKSASRDVLLANGFQDDCETVRRSYEWAVKTHRLDSTYLTAGTTPTPQEVLSALRDGLEKLRHDNILVMKMPFWGLSFDVNDLGRLSGFAYMILSLILAYSVVRQHETVYLSTWKVRRQCYVEQRYDDATSRANLLYHTLAMTQVFLKPPTLARWHRPKLSWLFIVLLFWTPPFFVLQLLKLDWDTREIGSLLSPTRADRILTIEIVAFVTALIASALCTRYLRAEYRLWREAFLDINPSYSKFREAAFLQWTRGGVRHRSTTPSWGLAITHDGGGTVLADNLRNKIWQVDICSGASKMLDSDFTPETLHIWRDQHGTVRGDFHATKGAKKDKVWTLSPGDEKLVETRGPGVITDSKGNAFFASETFRQPGSPRDERGLFLLTRTGSGPTTIVARGPGRYGAQPHDHLTQLHGMTVDGQDRLYFLDEERVWSYTAGAQPLIVCDDVFDQEKRFLHPRLMGIAKVGKDLYVADYDTCCVRRISGEGAECKVGIAFRSGPLWSPVGVCALQEDKIIILEQRPATVVGHLLALGFSWIRVRSAVVGADAAPQRVTTIGWWTWLRSQASRLVRRGGGGSEAVPQASR
jgi:hypothetical protein